MKNNNNNNSNKHKNLNKQTKRQENRIKQQQQQMHKLAHNHKQVIISSIFHTYFIFYILHIFYYIYFIFYTYFTHIIQHFLSYPIDKFSSLSKEERDPLYPLKNDNTIVIKGAGKSSEVVVWDREDYSKEAPKKL